MTTSATLDSSNVRLQAGEQVVIPLQIRNNGEIVEGYQIEVVGPSAAWTTVEPSTVSLYPGSSTTATVVFAPPRSSKVPAGELKFGVVVRPTEHPDEAVVPEGVLELLPFLDTTAELVPRTSQGRHQGRHQVAVDNRGNVPVTALLTASDPTGKLRGAMSPNALTVNPGEAAFADLRLRPERRIWRGAPVTHPFVVEVAPQDSPSVQLDGSYVQQPVLPPWLGRVLLALLALLLALIAIWFLLLKPAIKSSAEDAVKPQAQKAADDAAAAKKAAGQANGAAGSAAGSAKKAGAANGQVQQQLQNHHIKLAGTPVPFSSRLSALTPKHGSTTTSFSVPAKRTLQVRDLVMDNFQGDFGLLSVESGGNVLFTMALENFRDIDYHFASPIDIPAGGKLSMVVTCRKPGEPPAQPTPPSTCNTSMYFGGSMVKNP